MNSQTKTLRSRRTLAVLLGSMLLMGALTVVPRRADAAATMTITEYPLLTGGGEPSHLTVGPDGNAWVGMRAANKIARVTPEGVVTEFTVPTPDSYPSYLTPGPDGNVYFAEAEGHKIGRITPTGDITEFPVPSGNGPTDVVLGPDGNFWFTEGEADKIGRMTPAGVFTEFNPPTPNSAPSTIAAGPDGNLWTPLRDVNKIARITPAGVFTEFPIPTPNSDADGIEAGPDGNLWFAEAEGNKIGRITPQGVITEFPIPSPQSETNHVAPGPDGNMWFTETNTNKLGRITLQGVVTEFPMPSPAVGVHFNETDDLGNMWVTERDANKVAKVQIPLELNVSLDGDADGTVTSDPTGINCGTDCTDTFLSGTSVHLTAAPAGGADFSWGGDCSGTDPECDVTMSADKEVSAVFGTPLVDLVVTRKGKGKVSSTPAGIVCGSDCVGSYAPGTEVTLTKKPKRGWKFVKWGGACSGKKGCVVTLDADKAVTAKFKKKT